MRITRKSLIVIELCRPLTRSIDLKRLCARMLLLPLRFFRRPFACEMYRRERSSLEFVPRFYVRSFHVNPEILFLQLPNLHFVRVGQSAVPSIHSPFFMPSLSLCVCAFFNLLKDLFMDFCASNYVCTHWMRALNAKRISYRFFIFICINVPFVNGKRDIGTHRFQRANSKKQFFFFAFFLHFFHMSVPFALINHDSSVFFFFLLSARRCAHFFVLLQEHQHIAHYVTTSIKPQ